MDASRASPRLCPGGHRVSPSPPHLNGILPTTLSLRTWGASVLSSASPARSLSIEAGFPILHLSVPSCAVPTLVTDILPHGRFAGLVASVKLSRLFVAGYLPGLP